MRKPKKKKRQLVYIEWADAYSYSGWLDAGELKKWGESRDGWMVQQVGWLEQETKKYIIICARVSDKDNNDDGQEEYGFIQKIPTTWIRKRINLTTQLRRKRGKIKKKKNEVVKSKS